jgi:hypothetical protein
MDILEQQGWLVLPIFFSQEECNKYRAWIDKLFADEPDLDGLEIEGYNRLRVDNREISAMVCARLQQIFPEAKVLCKWFPTKYILGGGLSIHIDGEAYDGNIASTHTILIYLNGSPEEFTGGRTIFVEDYDDSLDPDSHPPENIITPRPGLALILEQNKLHFAESLNSGAKYILRGDICL